MTDGARESTPHEDGPIWRLALRNDLGAVGGANRSLEEFLRVRGADPEAVFSTALALEEAVTNIIKYGYDDDREHQILLEARLLPEEIVLQVTDDGHEFDPLRAPAAGLDGPIEERPIGGVGLHLLRNLARSISYERTGGKNVLTMSFAVSPPGGSEVSGKRATQD